MHVLYNIIAYVHLNLLQIFDTIDLNTECNLRPIFTPLVILEVKLNM